MAPLVYNYTYVHMLVLSSLQHLCGYVYIIIWVNPKALEVYSFYLIPFYNIYLRLIVITNRKTSYCDNRENIMINDIRENIAINDIDH